jgi:molecular chaperone GrpE
VKEEKDEQVEEQAAQELGGEAASRSSHSKKASHKKRPHRAEKKVEISLKELEALEAKAREREQFLEKLQRTTADFINYQKRAQREAEEWQRFATSDLVSELLGVLDNFQQALKAARENSDFDKFLQGVKIVEGEFLKVLEGAGLEPIEALGQPFDPALHEAVAQEATDAYPPGTVSQEIRKGYKLHGRVIRASRVVVARAPEEVSVASEEDNAEKSEERESEDDAHL